MCFVSIPYHCRSAGQSSAPARPWSLVQTEGAPTAPPWTVQSGPSGQGGGASGQGGGASRQMAHQLNGDIPIPGEWVWLVAAVLASEQLCNCFCIIENAIRWTGMGRKKRVAVPNPNPESTSTQLLL